MENLQRARLIQRARNLKNQIISECSKCKGRGREGCKCIKKSNLLIELAFANIPLEYWFLPIKSLDCSKTVKDKVKRYCLKIKKVKKLGLGICFYGKFGRGKTSLSIHVLKRAALTNSSIYFVTLAEMLNEIRVSFGYSGEELTNIQIKQDKNFVESDFLVIDNVGQEYRRDNSNFIPIVFDELMRKRKSNGKVTILTTNKDPNKLREVYGSALFSILESSLKIIEVRGKDHRKGQSDKIWRSL